MCSQVSESLSLKNQVCIFGGGVHNSTLRGTFQQIVKSVPKSMPFKVLPENRTSRIYSYILTHVCVHICIYVCVYIFVYMHVYIDIYTRGTERFIKGFISKNWLLQLWGTPGGRAGQKLLGSTWHCSLQIEFSSGKPQFFS